MSEERVRIALIDDDRLWAEALSEYLADKGFTTRYAEDAFRGLALLEEEPLALAVVDYHMPGMNGLELVRQVRRRGLPVPIILVSSDDDPALARRAQAEGLQLLSKSATPRFLLQTVEQTLRSLEHARAEARAHAPWNLLLTGPQGDGVSSGNGDDYQTQRASLS
jgi:DNA-binding response OmpR family regulator